MFVFEGNSFLSCFQEASEFVLTEAMRKSDMNEIQDVVLKVSFDSSSVDELAEVVARVSQDDRFKFGFEKATRAYEREIGNITKPSYVGRLNEYNFIKPGSNTFDGIRQFEVLERAALETPQASNLILSVHHPSDIEDGFRPGYVPCLSFLDVKYRHGSLNVKFYFRSCDFQEVLIYDIFFCQKIFQKIEDIFVQNPKVDISDRTVTFFFSRAFFYKRRSHLLSALVAETKFLSSTSQLP